MQQHKSSLRIHMQQRSRQANRQQQGRVVAQHIIDFLHTCSQQHPHSCRVALFVSMRDEIDLSMLQQQLQQHNIAQLIPYVCGQQLLFAAPHTHANCMPNSTTSLQHVAQCCLLLLPGLAFDAQGHRLGRGGGYYDRLLLRLRQESCCPVTVGVCMQHQLIETVPTQPHDQHVDAVCTPDLGIRYCSS
ncbi:MAG: 5-formyltetrahydrofolate cyclo-ligase [Myxococcota bacterium]